MQKGLISNIFDIKVSLPVLSVPSIMINFINYINIFINIFRIYVCTDSGREGEYIYRLVDQMIGVQNKVKKRVWISKYRIQQLEKYTTLI